MNAPAELRQDRARLRQDREELRPSVHRILEIVNDHGNFKQFKKIVAAHDVARQSLDYHDLTKTFQNLTVASHDLVVALPRPTTEAKNISV